MISMDKEELIKKYENIIRLASEGRKDYKKDLKRYEVENNYNFVMGRFDKVDFEKLKLLVIRIDNSYIKWDFEEAISELYKEYEKEKGGE